MRLFLIVELVALGSAALAQHGQTWVMDRSGINPTPQSVTSFDCARAASQVERMICSDLDLAFADGGLAEDYRILMRRLPQSERAELLSEQRAWLARRDRCRDRQCVTAAYEARRAAVSEARDQRDSWLRRNVSRVGQCQDTRIDWIGPRLMGVRGDLPQGSTVTFENAVYQVSYDREAPILASRVGDPVRVCLVSIPQGCPPNDDRGRIYTAHNLRTDGRWRLPDSSHRCGGA
jgi:uncharacterized protein YecT (DUF1311 family)